MKLALECPISIMDWVQPYGDFDFVLTHLMADFDYRNYYLKSDRFKILDNSTNELGEPCSIDEILHAADLILPDFICPPDFLGDAKKTMEALDEMSERIPDSASLLPILQSNGDDYHSITEFTKFLKSRNFDCIAVPYDIMKNRDYSVRELGSARYEIVSYLVRDFDWIHLLGLTDPNELSNYRSFDNVRSIDTGAPITNGLSGRRYGTDEPMSKKHMLNFDSDAPDLFQEKCILHNLAYLRQLLTKEDEWLI